MTKFLLTLDYELFFSEQHGTVENSLLAPTEELAKAAEKSGARLCLFVDACYLLRAREESGRHDSAQKDYSQVATQLTQLAARGHDIQLHIHPHWLDTSYDGDNWRIDTSRYKLDDFSQDEVTGIFDECAKLLGEIKQDDVYAYRAGGWCIQPAAKILSAMRNAGIWLDSTVYRGGHSDTDGREHDFRDAPASSIWRFSDDPQVPDPDGEFLEIPISACRYGIATFWSLAFRKLHSSADDAPFGDGAVMSASTAYYLQRLLRSTWSPVSIDAAKAASLSRVFAQTAKRDAPEIFNVMGHPKSVTRNGIRHLGEFLAASSNDLSACTMADFKHLNPANSSTSQR